MSPLQRCSSSSSSSSLALSTSSVNISCSTSATSRETTVSYVPYIRKRVAPMQLQALQRMFDVKSHPTREERLILANEVGMELKAVTNWFQNKRQTAKRKALVWNSRRATFKDKRSNSLNLDPVHRPFLSDPSKSRLMRPTISLDHIAELCERPSSVPLSAAPSKANRPPLTPSNRRTHRNFTTPQSGTGIWNHMPSSPIAPQSSPSVEEARLAVLPSRSKTFRSLEWACLKARRLKQTDDDENDELPQLSLSNSNTDNGEETDTDVEELVTPTTKSIPLPPCKSKHGTRTLSSKNKENRPVTVVCGARQSEDVEAAMLLLGFMGRR